MTKQQFAAHIVWGLAHVADRLNGGYVKASEYVSHDGGGVAKAANKILVKEWLRTGKFDLITEEDAAAAHETRRLVNAMVLKVIAGTVTPFELRALELAGRDYFSSDDMLAFSVISSLPWVIRAKTAEQAARDLKEYSERLDYPTGTTLRTDCRVIACQHSLAYGRYYVDAVIGESVVSFWCNTQLTPEATYHISCRVKSHHDNCTRLNYVTIIQATHV